jgi:hypothetical protein
MRIKVKNMSKVGMNLVPKEERSPMIRAPRKAPFRLPIPPITATTKALMIMILPCLE